MILTDKIDKPGLNSEAVEALLSVYMQRLAPLLAQKLKAEWPRIHVRFNTRMRSTLGRAYIDENRIELNIRLLERYPHELEPTLAHELAHLIAPKLFGRKGLCHDDGWKQIMSLLGFAPNRTHSLDVAGLKRAQKILGWAECGCPGRRHPLRSRVYRNIQRRRRYACLRCKQELRIVARDS